MVKRQILDRLAEAKAKMVAQTRRGWWRNTPKAFYLNEADLAEFLATDPPLIDAIFRLAPSCEHGFDSVPVRASKGSISRLYSESGTSVGVLFE